MCLAIPGQIEEIFQHEGLKMARVNFGGIRKSVCLEYAPEASLSNYVLVHVGFAISIINEDEAKRTYQILQADNELGELATELV